jgi:hypothetical protein
LGYPWGRCKTRGEGGWAGGRQAIGQYVSVVVEKIVAARLPLVRIEGIETGAIKLAVVVVV